MGHRKTQAVGVAGLHHRNRQQFGEPNQFRYGQRIMRGPIRVHARVLGLHQPACDLACIIRIGPRRPCEAHLVTRRKSRRPRERQHRRFPRDRQVDGPLGFAHRDLKQPADHQARIVLVFHAVVGLGVLPDDFPLVARFLHPLNRRFPGAAHRSGKRSVARPCGNQHRITAAPSRVKRRTVMQRAHVHVYCSRRRATTDHCASQRGIECDRLMHHAHQFRRRPAAHLGLCDGFLKEIHLGPRDEEQALDAAEGHGGDNCVGPFVGAVRSPVVVGAFEVSGFACGHFALLRKYGSG